MTSGYPQNQQNPPTDPKARPADQPHPQQRVPRRFKQQPGGEDPRGIDSGWSGGKHVEGFQERAVEAEEGDKDRGDVHTDK